MNERQEPDRGDAAESVPPAPASREQEPVTHSLKGSITIDLDTKEREEENDG